MSGAWIGGAVLLACLAISAGATVLVMAILIVGSEAQQNWNEYEAHSIGDWSAAELDTLMVDDKEGDR